MVLDTCATVRFAEDEPSTKVGTNPVHVTPVTFAVLVTVRLAAPRLVRPVTFPPVALIASAFCVAIVPMDVGGVGGKALEIKTQNAKIIIVQPVMIANRCLMVISSRPSTQNR